MRRIVEFAGLTLFVCLFLGAFSKTALANSCEEYLRVDVIALANQIDRGSAKVIERFENKAIGEYAEAYRAVSFSWRSIKEFMGAPEHLVTWSPKQLAENGYISERFSLSSEELIKLDSKIENLIRGLTFLGAPKALLLKIKNLRMIILARNRFIGPFRESDLLKMNASTQVKFLKFAAGLKRKRVRVSRLPRAITEFIPKLIKLENLLWWDTVYEGQFNPEGEMTIESVRSLSSGETVIAYEINLITRVLKDSGAKGVLRVSRFITGKRMITDKSMPEFSEE